MDNLVLTLFGEDGQELSYAVERIFGMEGTEQLYCAAFPVDDDNGGIIFLRCNLVKNGNEETTTVSVSDIPDTAEYHRVAVSYEASRKKAALEEVTAALSENDDYITVTDVDGNKVDFIIHTIFDDGENKRSYAAVQKIDDAGEIFEEISLYRFSEENGKAILEMIPSDMEYSRVREMFMHLIEST